jgi:hypothetical protein
LEGQTAERSDDDRNRSLVHSDVPTSKEVPSIHTFSTSPLPARQKAELLLLLWMVSVGKRKAHCVQICDDGAGVEDMEPQHPRASEGGGDIRAEQDDTISSSDRKRPDRNDAVQASPEFPMDDEDSAAPMEVQSVRSLRGGKSDEPMYERQDSNNGGLIKQGSAEIIAHFEK